MFKCTLEYFKHAPQPPTSFKRSQFSRLTPPPASSSKPLRMSIDFVYTFYLCIYKCLVWIIFASFVIAITVESTLFHIQLIELKPFKNFARNLSSLECFKLDLLNISSRHLGFSQKTMRNVIFKSTVKLHERLILCRIWLSKLKTPRNLKELEID